VFEGGQPDQRNPITHHLRDYLLAKKFGYTFDQIQNQPAAWLDWLLAIDGTITEVENKAYKQVE